MVLMAVLIEHKNIVFTLYFIGEVKFPPSTGKENNQAGQRQIVILSMVTQYKFKNEAKLC